MKHSIMEYFKKKPSFLSKSEKLEISSEQIKLKNEIKKLFEKINYVPIIETAINLVKKAKSLKDLRMIRDELIDFIEQKKVAEDIETLVPLIRNEEVVQLTKDIVRESIHIDELIKLKLYLQKYIKNNDTSKTLNDLVRLKNSIFKKQINKLIVDINHLPSNKIVTMFVETITNHKRLEKLRNLLQSYYRSIQNAETEKEINVIKTELYEDITDLVE